MPHILVVEDEPIGAEVAEMVCKAAGHSVCHAENGEVAMERLEHETYDLVLTDVLMPCMDGVRLVETIRRHPRLALLPVIAVTAVTDAAERRVLVTAGMDAVVDKPFRARALRDTIESVLLGRRAKDIGLSS